MPRYAIRTTFRPLDVSPTLAYTGDETHNNEWMNVLGQNTVATEVHGRFAPLTFRPLHSELVMSL